MSAQLPDGTRLAFDREGTVFAATYPNLKGAVKVGEGQDPNISGDGKQVAFEENSGAKDRRFCIRDAATGRLIRRHVGTQPKISPDGKRVAFSLYSGTRWNLWISDIALKAPRKITGSGKDDPAFPSNWTTNGLLIAYNDDLGGGIYALRPDGSVVRKESTTQIAGKQDTSIPFGCAWSDDLSRIAFEAQTGEEMVDGGQPVYGIFLYDFATKKRRLLTPKGMIASSPVWQNKNLLLFASSQNTKRYITSQITVMEVNTGTMRPLMPNATMVSLARRGV